MLKLHDYPDFDALSHALARQWLDAINHTPLEQPCSFALAGGTTPEPLYKQFDSLFAKNDPRPIQIVATDERWVADSDPQSNEGLLQRCFTKSRSMPIQHWNLITLKNNQQSPAEAVPAINFYLKTCIPHAFNAVILGMGTDGHIASLFPDAPQLLINDASVNCVAALHPQTRQARVSLSFSRLLNTKSIWIVITGTEKRAVLEHASPKLPIGALLAAARCDVDVFWCP